MPSDGHQKVTPSHLERDAYLYVRQSSLKQVIENTESTRRQYALKDRAISYGWPVEQIHVIDGDQGKSGAQTDGREGFQHLSGEVAMGRAGLVMGLEVSRLARNSLDWHRLLEVCAMSNTLILDEDGIYDPTSFNDRLLLGLKGTMSEAELHIIRSRMQGGRLNKARRGELAINLPVGLTYSPDKNVVLDPDRQVQDTLRLFFETFCRLGSARATVKYFNEEKLPFPKQIRTGPNKGQVVWVQLDYQRALLLLHNPRYAGAYVYGRRKNRRHLDGSRGHVLVPREQWLVLLKDAHLGYITWQEYESNLDQLTDNAVYHGDDRGAGPPREGPALLQGRVVCGICGERMQVRYRIKKGQKLPSYVCGRKAARKLEPLCQFIVGEHIDQAIGELLIKLMTPMNVEISLAVQKELETRFEEADQLRLQLVERSRYEAELARRRYMKVDPDNRLVADALEADWNVKLRLLKKAQSDYELENKKQREVMDEETQKKIRALTNDFPSVWNDPKITFRDRKRILRLLVDDVTLIKEDKITVHIRFKGGATQTLSLPRPLTSAQARRHRSEVISKIDSFLDQDWSYSEISEHLNNKGERNWEGDLFTAKKVANIRYVYGLKNPYQRLRDKGLLTVKEVAEQLNISVATVHAWRNKGIIRCKKYSERRHFSLYTPLDYIRIVKKGTAGRPPIIKIIPIKSKSERGAV